MNERLVFGYGAKGHTGAEPAQDAIRAESRERPPQPGTASAEARPRPSPRRRPAREKSDWAFLGLMIFTALLFFRPQDTIPLLNPLHLAELAALGALGAMISGRLGRGLTATRVTPELLAVAALGAIILATAPFSIWPGGAVRTFTDLFAKVMLIFILMLNTLTSPKRIQQFTWLIVVASGYIAFRAVFDYARGLNLIENGRVQGAVGGMFRNPNDLALNMVAVLPLALSLALRPVSPIARTLAVSCAGLMMGAVVASHSRSGTLGLMAVALVFGAHLVRRRPMLVTAALLGVALALPLVPESYWSRVATIFDESSDNTGSRPARKILLREGYQAFLAHPVTGVGAGMFKAYKPEGRDEAWRETHNVLLQVAAELGITGLLVFGFLIACAAAGPLQTRRMLRRARDSVPTRERGGGARSGRAVAREPAHRHRADAPLLSAQEYELLDAHNGAMLAAVTGWFVCALFASVAYHWTFYYMLALAVMPREIVASRLASGASQQSAVVVSAPAGAPA